MGEHLRPALRLPALTPLSSLSVGSCCGCTPCPSEVLLCTASCCTALYCTVMLYSVPTPCRRLQARHYQGHLCRPQLVGGAVSAAHGVFADNAESVGVGSHAVAECHLRR